MSFELEASLPQEPGTRWTPQAVAGLVGQRPEVMGRPGRVVDARMDDQGQVHVTLEVEGVPDLTALGGYSTWPGVEQR